MQYDTGDEVVLKIAERFGYDTTVYRSAKVQVIGYDTTNSYEYVQYLCYVPPYVHVPSAFTINRQHVKVLGVDPKFLGENGCFITFQTPIYDHIRARPGERCSNCGEFYEYAEKTDGDFTCRACIENPYR